MLSLRAFQELQKLGEMPPLAESEKASERMEGCVESREVKGNSGVHLGCGVQGRSHDVGFTWTEVKT